MIYDFGVGLYNDQNYISGCSFLSAFLFRHKTMSCYHRDAASPDSHLPVAPGGFSSVGSPHRQIAHMRNTFDGLLLIAFKLFVFLKYITLCEDLNSF